MHGKSLLRSLTRCRDRSAHGQSRYSWFPIYLKVSHIMKTKIDLFIFAVLPLLTGISETKACIGHLLQDNWPPHAMFHMFMGLGGLLATYGLILFLT